LKVNWQHHDLDGYPFSTYGVEAVIDKHENELLN
jgi:hypothetical protein